MRIRTRAVSTVAWPLMRTPPYFGLFADAINSEARYIEHYGIRSRDRANLLEGFEQRSRIGIAETEKIEITRRPKWIIEPCREQHRAFQDEALAMPGRAETIEETLQHVTGQEQVERLVALFGEAEQARPDGGSDVARSVRHLR